MAPKPSGSCFPSSRGWKSEVRGSQGWFLLRPLSVRVHGRLRPVSVRGLPSAHPCPHSFLEASSHVGVGPRFNLFTFLRALFPHRVTF